MDESPTQPFFDSMLRVMRILIFALCMGLVFFGGIALVVAKAPTDAAVPMLAWIGIVFGASACIARQVIRSALNSAARKTAIGNKPIRIGTLEPKTIGDRLLIGYQTRMIVSAALLEGAGFFNLVCFITEDHWISFAVASVCLAINLSTFPSQDGVEAWIQEQLDLINLERQQVN